MRYAEFRQHWQDSLNRLPFKAAFGDKQFKEMMAEWELTTNEDDLKKFAHLSQEHIALPRTNICSTNG